MKTKAVIFLFICSTICMLAAEMPNGNAAFVLPPDSISAKQSDATVVPLDSLAAVYARLDSLDKAFDKMQADTILLSVDTLQTDSLANDTTKKVSKSVLDFPVTYTASDSVTYEADLGNANLYGEGQVNYTNLELIADQITMNLDSSLVHATGRPDSAGNMVNQPIFRQGADQYEPERISYNFKTRKAFIDNVYTQQGNGYLISEESKRDAEGVLYVRHGKYTTCNAKHPHFYLALTRAKVRPGQDVVFGPAYLVVEDVPLPLAVPYGFFPFSKEYSSGFIMPTYGDESTRGFYLRDGGYYFAINDRIDLKLIGEIYTKGSWGLSAQSTYKKRYRFSGSFYLSYQNSVEGEKNMPDYVKSTSFKIQWSHKQDSKANPNQSLSASVNFATSNYEQNNLTSMYNPTSYTQSTRTSSVAYSRSFDNLGLTLSASGNLSQNTRDSSLSMTMPSLDITVARFYPCKRKKAAGKERWYEKIAVSYTGALSNSIDCKEDELFHSNLIKDWSNGMKHSIPISATFSVFNYINITPSFTFTDRMYTHEVKRSWDAVNQEEVRDTIWGFRNVYNYDMSVSATTNLYGFYTPHFGKRIQTIRHVFTPTVSFSYAPDFGAERYGYYATYVKTDTAGNVSTVTYSPYSDALYGVPSSGMTGSISMDVSNNVEMKVRAKNDSLKKISLIDEFGLSLSYNMAAKEKPWSDLTMRVRIKTPWNYTFSMNATFATYAYEFDEDGDVIEGNTTEWSHGRFGRFQGMSQNFSYTFSNQTFSKLFGWGRGGKETDEKPDDGELPPEEDGDTNIDPEMKQNEAGSKKDKKKQTEIDSDGYMKFQLPWTFTVSYGVTMSENTSAPIRTHKMRYPYKFTHSLNFSGSVSISDGWALSYSSGYDFNSHSLSMTTASVGRDLHCFSISASLVLSPYTSYNITFSADSSELADVLKWKKQSSYSSNIEWY